MCAELHIRINIITIDKELLITTTVFSLSSDYLSFAEVHDT